MKNIENIMNKLIILGILIMAIGFSFPIFFSNDGTDFLFGFLVTTGICLIILGIIKLKKVQSEI